MESQGLNSSRYNRKSASTVGVSILFDMNSELILDPVNRI